MTDSSTTKPTNEAAAATIHVLDRLLVLCTDGRDGYRRAAEAIKEPRSIHQVLANNAVARDQMVSVLTNKLVSIGHPPAHHGSIAGAIHRRWVDAIAALKPDATVAILHECRRGEQETLAGFTSALGRGLPEDIHAFVQSQLGRVFDAISSLQRAITDLESARSSVTSSSSHS